MNFKNTIIIMTSNLGSDLIRERLSDVPAGGEQAAIDETRELVLGLLKKTIRPEFLNRIDETIVFTPLGRSEIDEIVRISSTARPASCRSMASSFAIRPLQLNGSARRATIPSSGHVLYAVSSSMWCSMSSRRASSRVLSTAPASSRLTSKMDSCASAKGARPTRYC